MLELHDIPIKKHEKNKYTSILHVPQTHVQAHDGAYIRVQCNSVALIKHWSNAIGPDGVAYPPGAIQRSDVIPVKEGVLLSNANV